jgi:hypothetical protein
MALLLALTLFQHLIDGFRNHDLRQHVADLLGVTLVRIPGDADQRSEVMAIAIPN